jgi:hypothetical protein
MKNEFWEGEGPNSHLITLHSTLLTTVVYKKKSVFFVTGRRGADDVEDLQKRSRVYHYRFNRELKKMGNAVQLNTQDIGWLTGAS